MGEPRKLRAVFVLCTISTIIMSEARTEDANMLSVFILRSSTMQRLQPIFIMWFYDNRLTSKFLPLCTVFPPLRTSVEYTMSVDICFRWNWGCEMCEIYAELYRWDWKTLQSSLFLWQPSLKLLKATLKAMQVSSSPARNVSYPINFPVFPASDVAYRTHTLLNLVTRVEIWWNSSVEEN